MWKDQKGVDIWSNLPSDLLTLWWGCGFSEGCHRLDFPILQSPSAFIVLHPFVPPVLCPSSLCPLISLSPFHCPPFFCSSSPLSFQSFVLPHCPFHCVLFLQYLSIVPLLSYCPFSLSYCHLLYIVLTSFLSLKSNRFQSFFLVSLLVDSQSTSCYRLYASFWN